MTTALYRYFKIYTESIALTYLEKWSFYTSFASYFVLLTKDKQIRTTGGQSNLVSFDMKTKTVITVLLIFGLATSCVQGQSGFLLPGGVKQIEIPFEYVNSFIILNIAFNGSLPLKFIFDTGAEHTILTKREISDLLQVHYDREFRP